METPTTTPKVEEPRAWRSRQRAGAGLKLSVFPRESANESAMEIVSKTICVQAKTEGQPMTQDPDEEALRRQVKECENGSWDSEAAMAADAKLKLIVGEEVGRIYWNDCCGTYWKAKAEDSCAAKEWEGVAAPLTVPMGKVKKGKGGKGPPKR